MLSSEKSYSLYQYVSLITRILIDAVWFTDSVSCGGWSGGAMVLGKLPVPGRPTNLDHSMARAYCACSMCGWGMFGHFFSRL